MGQALLRDNQDPAPAEATSYYETVDGFQCDRAIIDACREAVKGPADGRVSVQDAKKVFEKIADGNKETRCERWTLRFCLTNFNFTKAACDWITEACKELPQEDAPEEPSAKKAKCEGTSYYETVDGMKCDRGMVGACRGAIEGKRDGRISLDDAKKVFAQMVDHGEITPTEMWTLRYCLTEFKWTEAAMNWVVSSVKAEKKKEKS